MVADSNQPQDANSDGIRNTTLRRCLTLRALKTTARFYKWTGTCIPISSRIIVKKGQDVSLTEAETMDWVSSHTTIPLRRVHRAFTRKNETYIVMACARGKTFAGAWPELSDAQVESIFTQLRGMLDELLALPAPGIGIQNCMGGPLRDCRILRNPMFGPFPSTREFYKWLREGLEPGQKTPYVSDEESADIQRMISMQDQEWGKPVFTHADLNPFNIMILDGKIEAIIDWEFSGRLPPYWEYTSVWLGNKTRTGWQDLVTKFVDPWPKALPMEATRQQW